MNVADVGKVIRSYRKASGLSQKDLAKLGGLSRATLNYLESGRDIEVGAGKLLALLECLGIPLGLPHDVDRSHDDQVVEKAAKAINGKGRKRLTGQAVLEALATGQAPAEWQGQIGQFLEEVPEEVILAAVRSAAARSGASAKEIWKKARHLAKSMETQRGLWLKSA